jgi:hypothetical protein
MSKRLENNRENLDLVMDHFFNWINLLQMFVLLLEK